MQPETSAAAALEKGREARSVGQLARLAIDCQPGGHPDGDQRKHVEVMRPWRTAHGDSRLCGCPPESSI
jgi:hypothetical protein